MKAMKLPLIKNTCDKPKLQAWASDQLQGMELKVYYRLVDWDGLEEWDIETDFSDAEGNPYFSRHYDMIGLDLYNWVFLISMTGKVFRLNGDWYTVIINEHKCHQLRRIPNGDEAEKRFQLEWEKYECRA